jgi:diguanylate cyclase (GGDEF)-like protein
MLIEHFAEEGHSAQSTEILKRALGQARRKIASLDQTDSATGLLSAAQFTLMLRRDLAVSRREQRSLHLMLFAIPELDVYRQTFGNNAADSCLRMVSAQIAGTFRRASDLSARLDEATFAVATIGQDQSQIADLVYRVERKARDLGLHNPRGRIARYVVVQGTQVAADPDADDAESLIERARAAIADAESDSGPAAAESA